MNRILDDARTAVEGSVITLMRMDGSSSDHGTAKYRRYPPPPPAHQAKVRRSSKITLVKRGLSGADIVRDEQKQRLREVQRNIDELKSEKRRLETSCKHMSEKITKENAPSKALMECRKETEIAIRKIDELTDILHEAGITDLSDADLKRRCEELEKKREELKKLKGDKEFLLKTLIELVGGKEKMRSLIDEAAAEKQKTPSPKRKGNGRLSVASLLRNKEYANLYQDGTWDFVHSVDTGTGKRVVIMSPAEKNRREELATNYRLFLEQRMQAKMTPSPAGGKGEGFGLLKTGADAVDFFKKSATAKSRGEQPRKVQYTPRRDKNGERKKLLASSVVTNRTPLHEVMTKTGEIVTIPDSHERIDTSGTVQLADKSMRDNATAGESDDQGDYKDDNDPRSRLENSKFDAFKAQMLRLRKKGGIDYRIWKRDYESQHDRIVSSLRGQLQQIDVAAELARDEILHLDSL